MARALEVEEQFLNGLADDTMCVHACLLPCRTHAHIRIYAHVYMYITCTSMDESTCVSTHMLTHMCTYWSVHGFALLLIGVAANMPLCMSACRSIGVYAHVYK